MWTLGCRIQMFNDDKTTVPGLPYEAWVSASLAQEPTKRTMRE